MLEGTSFAPATTRPSPYHILSVEGGWHSGKTHFALTAPKPIGYQSFDFSTDGVVEKFEDDRARIYIAEYQVPVDTTADELQREGKKEAAQAQADKQANHLTNTVWKPFKRDFEALVADPEIKTIVWDTATEINACLRLCNFGKIERNPQLGNGLVNAEINAMIRAVTAAKKNFILLHQIGDEYKEYVNPESNKKESVKTGKKVRRGNANIEYLVQSFVKSEYVLPKAGSEELGEFRVTIVKPRLNPKAFGQVLISPDWATLMGVLMPHVDPEAWL